MMIRSTVAGLLLVCLPAVTRAADSFAFTLLPATSSTSWNFSVNAPFQTGGASFLLGNFDAVNNPGGTRTIPGFIGGDLNANTPVPITAGGVTASGNSGTSPLHPAGVFQLALDPAGGRCELRGLSLNLLNGATTTAGANLSITYSTFRTRQPTCLVLGGIPLTLPLGSATLSAMSAVQDTPAAVGTLTQTAPNQYAFAVPVGLLVSVTATLNGAPLDVPPQPAAIVLAGTIVVSGGTATITASFDVTNDQTQPGPTPLPAQNLTEPLCQGALVATIVLASQTTHVGVNTSLSAAGVLLPPACDPDLTQDGNVDQDDIAYLVQIIAGGANPLNADPDFNHDGNADQDDIALLVAVVAGQPCP